ncbi:MAG: hypothetical protein KDK65_05115 [Chlamydiia bacterium]|nr:hypothetical protein [Chlamydiia bacterium]
MECEAKPLIVRYHLQLMEEQPFRCYGGNNFQLIISGVGKVFVAAATALLGTSNAFWLNVGLAGHRSLPRGTGVLAHQIVDQATGNCYYPPFMFQPPCPTARILTVDSPETSYPEESAYDMEASAFFAVANRFSPAELIHSYKVISDNSHESTTAVNAKLAHTLIENQLDDIERLIEALKMLPCLPQPIDLKPYLEQWHFTATEQHLLRKYAPAKPQFDTKEAVMRSLQTPQPLTIDDSGTIY